MNAQEAIEIISEELESGKMNTKTLEKIFETELRDDRESLEALSIVLESAKLFHRYVVPQMEWQYEKLGLGFKSVYGVPIEKIGIEEGADE